MLQAIVSYMPVNETTPGIGSINYSPTERLKLAQDSLHFVCPNCGPINTLIQQMILVPKNDRPVSLPGKPILAAEDAKAQPGPKSPQDSESAAGPDRPKVPTTLEGAETQAQRAGAEESQSLPAKSDTAAASLQKGNENKAVAPSPGEVKTQTEQDRPCPDAPPEEEKDKPSRNEAPTRPLRASESSPQPMQQEESKHPSGKEEKGKPERTREETKEAVPKRRQEGLSLVGKLKVKTALAQELSKRLKVLNTLFAVALSIYVGSLCFMYYIG